MRQRSRYNHSHAQTINQRPCVKNISSCSLSPCFFCSASSSRKKISASHSSSTPQTFKVFEIIFNPIIESQGNRTLIDLRNWNDPLTLNAQFVSDVQTHSHGYVNYTIEQIEVDDIPQKKDDFDYTDETYLDCLSDSSKCHQPRPRRRQQRHSDHHLQTLTLLTTPVPSNENHPCHYTRDARPEPACGEDIRLSGSTEFTVEVSVKAPVESVEGLDAPLFFTATTTE